ncbi:hypothetical protein [Daejeonella sp.]|uniref:hypothetical protein n=1 Tax=Daejeonella sp. TaxID=2805397 RepID=UPI0030BB9B65
MNRLIFSAIGVILTFAWIVYTAPSKPEKIDTEVGKIKKISKSGSTSLHKITQPIYKSIESRNINAGSKVLVMAANERNE